MGFNATRQEPIWCKGKVAEANHYDCPPRHVASWEEVTKFCTREAYRVNQTHYRCDYYNRPVCSGTIDPSIGVPKCTVSANDCTKADIDAVCMKKVSPVQQDLCGAKFDYEKDGTWKYGGNVIECSDRHSHNWCRAEMDPQVTQKYIEEETCPLDSLDFCRDLSKQFKRPWFCHCIKNASGQDVAFSCHHDGKAEPWCQGKIEKPQFDEHFKPIEKEHRTPPPQVEEEEKPMETTGGRAGVSLAAVSVVAVALVVILRRRATGREAIASYDMDDYGDDVHELELNSSSTYTDRPSEAELQLT